MGDKLRSRGWVFVVNNYSEEEYNNIKKHLHTNTTKCWIMGKEIGKIEKTPHIQGYVYWKNTKTQSAMKKIMPRAKLIVAKGDLKQNYNYCSKDGNFECDGNFGLEETKTKFGGYTNIEEQIDNEPFRASKQERITDYIEEYMMDKREDDDIYETEDETDF